MQLEAFANHFINKPKRHPFPTVSNHTSVSPLAGEIWRVQQCKEESALVLVTVAEEGEFRGVLVSDSTWFASDKDIIIRSDESPIGMDILICTWCDIPIHHSSFFEKIVEVSTDLFNSTLLMLHNNLEIDSYVNIYIKNRGVFTHTAYSSVRDDCDFLELPIMSGDIHLGCRNNKSLAINVCLGTFFGFGYIDSRKRVQHHIRENMCQYQ